MQRRSLSTRNNGKRISAPKNGKHQKKVRGTVLYFLLFSFAVAVLILLVAISALPDPNPQHDEGERPLPMHGLPKRHKHLKTHTGRKHKKGDAEYYMVFSTACSAFQDWQSYVLFYSAMKVKQPGHVIRLASGCDEKKTEILKKVHEERIKPMSENFHVHFTPDFAGKGKAAYKYNNKPFGLRHFMENFLGYPDNRDADDAIIVIVDPDQMLLKPITNDFTNHTVIWKKGPAEMNGTKTPRNRVEHGFPMAQMYAFGDQPFRKVNLTTVAGEDSRTLKVTKEQAAAYYPAGPPYIATARDMYKIAFHWTKFMPQVHKEYPELLGEMFGYCISSAHLGLPHQLAESFMVSDPDCDREGWPLIDSYPLEKMCEPDVVPIESSPQVFHYCQRYWLGKWFIGKYRLDANFISCEAPLLTVPPKDLGLQYDYYMAPGAIPYGKKEKLSPRQVKRHAWSICLMIRVLNEVATYFKKNHCDETANYNMTYVFGPNRTEYQSKIQQY